MDTTYRIVPDWPAYRVGNDGSIWSRWRKGWPTFGNCVVTA